MVKQERALRTRESLVRAAAELFQRDGYTIASLTTISRAAGVSSGALHFHFASKAALADAVEEAALTKLQALTRDTPQAAAGSSLQRLVDATHRLAHVLSEDPVLRAGFELCSDPARTPRIDLREQWQRWIEQVLQRAGEDGELRPEVVPDGAATAVVAGTVGLEVLSSRKADWLFPETVARFWQVLLPTLAAPDLLPRPTAVASGPTIPTN
ncbi:ScbR family autoregulator-binding transcription factor [Kitasatospora sp. LaBMicrA B282]|uniref:ScbR family autoregulator-binding transcription factor n=1 Tax=Kitasatospora sp. LaBMicrA B282 TaxID=3420949 RepID=UPI003D11EB00